MSGLFLSRLTLSHFRSHKRAVLDVDLRPVAIFGPNGAGKTNLIEAISLLSPGRGMRRAGLADLSRRPEVLGWKITAQINGARHVHEVETGAEAGQPRTVRIDDKAASQVALGSIARILWLVPAMDRLWIEGAEGRRRFLDRATLSFQPSHASTVLRYEKAMRERNRLLKDMVRDPHWYTALEAQMAEAGAEIHTNRSATLGHLAQAQADTTTAFPTADLTLVQAEDGAPTTQEGLCRAFADGRTRDMAAGRTLTGPHRADLEAIYANKGVNARDCSTGEQKALLISLILANGRALASDHGAPPILLLDEVAAHLDADRRAALYDEICALGAQAWMTGTGPELFAELDTRAQYAEVTDTDGQSTITQRTAP
ncbi:DNA replication/repair protein RecF [Yoonia sp. R2331]|uniref:DNA replication/repair protein RecF n=1 Tax=Yoonia sp. R2331 TaxID=3237238 RepID=UPI0034E48E6D